VQQRLALPLPAPDVVFPAVFLIWAICRVIAFQRRI
jgi:hypothetical protein